MSNLKRYKTFEQLKADASFAAAGKSTNLVSDLKKLFEELRKYKMVPTIPIKNKVKTNRPSTDEIILGICKTLNNSNVCT